MDVVSFAWSRAVNLRAGARKHTMIGRGPFPNSIAFGAWAKPIQLDAPIQRSIC
jgi:hypothetical protein